MRSLCASCLMVALALPACVVAADGDGPGTIWARTLSPEVGRPFVAAGSDVAGDEGDEILVLAGERGRPVTLLVLRGTDGQELWRRTLRRGAAATPVARRLHDVRDVAVASGDTLALLDGETGEVLLSARLPGVVGDIVAGDLDGDGVDEIVCTSGMALDDTLSCWDAGGLTPRWRAVCPPAEGRFDDGYRMPAILHLGVSSSEDADASRRPCVFVREHRTTLVALTSSGEEIWRAVLGHKSGIVPTGTATTLPFPVDCDGSGRRDIAVGTLDGTVLLIDPDCGDVLMSRVFGGEEHRKLLRRRSLPKALRRLLSESGEPATGFAALDVDGVPGEELLFATSDGVAHAYSVRGDTLLWKRPVDGGVEFEPIVGRTADGRDCAVFFTGERVHYVDPATGADIRPRGPGNGCSLLLLGRFTGVGRFQMLSVRAGKRTLSLHDTALRPVAP